MAKIHDLPSELLETIVDFLHSDIRTLKMCTLVCRAWLIPSRYHLLYNLNVPNSMLHKLKLQLSMDPKVFAPVQTLHLYTPPVPYAHEIMTNNPIHPELLVILFRSLSFLHTVKLSTIPVGPGEAELQCNRLPLRLLDICGLLKAETLCRTIAIFSRVELEVLHVHDLAIIRYDCPEFKAILRSPYPGSWKVHMLRLGSPRMDISPRVVTSVHSYLLDIFDYLISFDSLSTLDLTYGLGVLVLDKLSTFVASRVSGITELKMDVTKYQDDPEPLFRFLDKFTALKAVSLTMDAGRHFLEGQRARFGNDLIPATLVHLYITQTGYTIDTTFFPISILPHVPSKIHALTLRFNGLIGDLHLNKWLETATWTELQVALQRFASLEVLRILTDATKTLHNVDVSEERIQCSIGETQQAAFVGGLPELHRLGTLKF